MDTEPFLPRLRFILQPQFRSSIHAKAKMFVIKNIQFYLQSVLTSFIQFAAPNSTYAHLKHYSMKNHRKSVSKLLDCIHQLQNSPQAPCIKRWTMVDPPAMGQTGASTGHVAKPVVCRQNVEVVIKCLWLLRCDVMRF